MRFLFFSDYSDEFCQIVLWQGIFLSLRKE